MKTLLAALVLTFLAGTAHADGTTLYDVTSYVYQPCGLEFCQGPQIFQLQLTTEMETGNFYVWYLGLSVTGPLPVVTAVTGTFYDSSGQQFPVSYTYESEGDFLFENLLPVDIFFTANGSTFDVTYTGDEMMVYGAPLSDFQAGDMLGWDITKVPEPAPSLLLGMGLAALLCLFGKLKIHEANN